VTPARDTLFIGVGLTSIGAGDFRFSNGASNLVCSWRFMAT